MDVFADRRSLVLGDVLEEDPSTEKNLDEEDDHVLTHSELVETEASLDDQSEQAKIAAKSLVAVN